MDTTGSTETGESHKTQEDADSYPHPQESERPYSSTQTTESAGERGNSGRVADATSGE